MGIISYLENAIDTVVTTVKEVVSPQSAEKAKKAENKENIELVREETLSKNEDSLEIKNNRTRNAAYKQIEELCVKYNIDLEEAKRFNLLEGITGFSSEELATKSPEELKPYIKALEDTLSNRNWAFWKSNQGEDNIKEIAKNANNKYIDSVTGRGFWGNLFRCSADLSERLEKAGYSEVNEANVKSYFNSLISEAVNSDDIKEAYENAFKIFGDILKDTDSPELKALATAAISELESSVRGAATKLTLTSCGNDTRAKEVVAKGIADNYEEITCSKDALGNFTDEDTNITIAKSAFQYMSQMDTLETLNNWNKRRNDIMQARSSGIPVSESADRFASTAYSQGMAGAITGSASHSSTDSNGQVYEQQTVLQEIDRMVAAAGLSQEVYTYVEKYLNSHPNEFPRSASEIETIINKATNYAYSNAISSTGASSGNNKTNNASNRTNDNKAETTTTNRSSSDTDSDRQNFSDTTVSNRRSYSESELTTSNGNTTGTHQNTAGADSKDSSTATTKAGTTTLGGSAPESKDCTPQQKEKPITKEKAIAQGVKTVKQYAKDNNVSTFELAIDSLSSSNLNQNTRTWALNEFKAASASLQKVNFIRISNLNNAKAAAACMNQNDRENLRSRSFDIKEAVDELNEENVA